MTRQYVDPAGMGFISPAWLRGRDGVFQGPLTSRCISSRGSEVGFEGVRWCIRDCFARMQLSQLMFPSTECTQRPLASDWRTISLMLAAPAWPSLRCQSSTDFDCKVERRVHEVRISLVLLVSSCDRFVAVPLSLRPALTFDPLSYLPSSNCLCRTQATASHLELESNRVSEASLAL